VRSSAARPSRSGYQRLSKEARSTCALFHPLPRQHPHGVWFEDNRYIDMDLLKEQKSAQMKLAA